MRTIKLGMEQSYCNIKQLYDKVAQALGYEDTENLHYDCAYINVAPNIADNVLAYMKEEEKFEAMERGMLWVCFGPKADENLKDDVIMVDDGFITEVGNE